MIEFSTAPEVGSLLLIDSQEYELREVLDHVRKDGSGSSILVWESSCPACGSGFEVTTGLVAKGVNRRCGGCAKAGKPVKGKRGRKLKVEVIAP